MTTIKTIPVSDRAWAVTLPGAVLAFNVDSDPDGRLSEVLSANPGMPAAFFNLTVCDEIFSMAENRVRSFVLADNPENRAAFADAPAEHAVSRQHTSRDSRWSESDGH